MSNAIRNLLNSSLKYENKEESESEEDLSGN